MKNPPRRAEGRRSATRLGASVRYMTTRMVAAGNTQPVYAESDADPQAAGAYVRFDASSPWYGVSRHHLNIS